MGICVHRRIGRTHRAELLAEGHEEVDIVPGILSAEGERHEPLPADDLRVGDHVGICRRNLRDADFVEQRLVVEYEFLAYGDDRYVRLYVAAAEALFHGVLVDGVFPAGDVPQVIHRLVKCPHWSTSAPGDRPNQSGPSPLAMATWSFLR